MSLYDSFLKLKFDKRMKTWNLNQGLVTEKEIKENLKSLQDVNENAESMVLFPEFSDPAKIEKQASQQSQTQQNQPLNKEEDSTTYDTQSATITSQTGPQEAHSEDMTGGKEIIANKEEDINQKSNEDPSNPWW